MLCARSHPGHSFPSLLTPPTKMTTRGSNDMDFDRVCFECIDNVSIHVAGGAPGIRALARQSALVVRLLEDTQGACRVPLDVPERVLAHAARASAAVAEAEAAAEAEAEAEAEVEAEEAPEADEQLSWGVMVRVLRLGHFLELPREWIAKVPVPPISPGISIAELTQLMEHCRLQPELMDAVEQGGSLVARGWRQLCMLWVIDNTALYEATMDALEAAGPHKPPQDLRGKPAALGGWLAAWRGSFMRPLIAPATADNLLNGLAPALPPYAAPGLGRVARRLLDLAALEVERVAREASSAAEALGAEMAHVYLQVKVLSHVALTIADAMNDDANEEDALLVARLDARLASTWQALFNAPRPMWFGHTPLRRLLELYLDARRERAAPHLDALPKELAALMQEAMMRLDGEFESLVACVISCSDAHGHGLFRGLVTRALIHARAIAGAQPPHHPAPVSLWDCSVESTLARVLCAASGIWTDAAPSVAGALVQVMGARASGLLTWGEPIRLFSDEVMGSWSSKRGSFGASVGGAMRVLAGLAAALGPRLTLDLHVALCEAAQKLLCHVHKGPYRSWGAGAGAGAGRPAGCEDVERNIEAIIDAAPLAVAATRGGRWHVARLASAGFAALGTPEAMDLQHRLMALMPAPCQGEPGNKRPRQAAGK